MTCPICNNSELSIVYENKAMPYGINLKNSIIDLEITFCHKCSFTFQSSAYFNKNYDDEIHKLYKNYKITDMYNFPNRSKFHKKALNFISEDIQDSINYNVLEIGSNRGDFLYLLKEKFPKINVIGCEPTEFDELLVPTINSFFQQNLFNTKFDLIILRHTLEHIKYPIEFIQSLFKILKDQHGKIFIEVPNLLYSIENFIDYFTPDHVNYFSVQTLEKTCKSYNLEKKDDSTEFLYTIFSKKPKSQPIKKIKYSQDTILEAFNIYNKKLNKLTMEIKKYDRIIFYGISNFYLWTYSRFKNILDEKELFFMDDNLQNDTLFNLPKVLSFKENDLIILCTSNIEYLEKMKNNLVDKNIKILIPWRGIESK